jgi:hypothetical protein
VKFKRRKGTHEEGALKRRNASSGGLEVIVRNKSVAKKVGVIKTQNWIAYLKSGHGRFPARLFTAYTRAEVDSCTT